MENLVWISENRRDVTGSARGDHGLFQICDIADWVMISLLQGRTLQGPHQLRYDHVVGVAVPRLTRWFPEPNRGAVSVRMAIQKQIDQFLTLMNTVQRRASILL